MIIAIKDIINGDTAVSYSDGLACLDMIKGGLDNGDEITLDFDSVDYVITAFLNPIIGDLILEKGIDVMKCIRIVNANPKTIEKIKMVRDGALLKREDVE